MRPGSAPRFEFGDFVFDAASGDLRRNGSAARLPPQVAALLELLVRRRGAVVSRTELRDALWPETTVEFDQGLNFCVRQLRVALSDDAAFPKYIETLHRRGYRFIASVRAVGDEPVFGSDDPPVDATRRRPKPRWQALTFVATLAAALIAAFAVTRLRHYEPESRLAVLYFDAPADDTVLAGYRAQLAEALVATAGRGRLNELAVMGPSFTFRFAGMSTPPDTIRAAIGATHVLSGALRREGGRTQIFAQLIRTSDRRHMYAVRFDSISRASQIASIADSIARAATMIVLRDHL
ncbi:MAG: winged helix-turn-helix domain-containing protein [bacterium]